MFRIHRKLFLDLKKVSVVRITTPQVPTAWLTSPTLQKISDPPSLNTIWKIEYSGVEVLVLAWLTSSKVSVQQLKMCFCLQMLVNSDLMKLMVVEMGFMNFQKVNLCQLHSSPREMWHTFGKLLLSVPLSSTPIVLKNFVGSCSSGLVPSIKHCKL